MEARSITCCNSRTLPGQECFSSRRDDSCDNLCSSPGHLKLQQEMLRQGVHISPALGEREATRWERPTAGKTGLRETAFSRARLGEVGVGGGNYPHVHAKNIGAAQPLHLALIEKAQQLGLNAQRHIADLVQKQRSRHGRCECGPPAIAPLR